MKSFRTIVILLMAIAFVFLEAGVAWPRRTLGVQIDLLPALPPSWSTGSVSPPAATNTSVSSSPSAVSTAVASVSESLSRLSLTSFSVA